MSLLPHQNTLLTHSRHLDLDIDLPFSNQVVVCILQSSIINCSSSLLLCIWCLSIDSLSLFLSLSLCSIVILGTRFSSDDSHSTTTNDDDTPRGRGSPGTRGLAICGGPKAASHSDSTSQSRRCGRQKCLTPAESSSTTAALSDTSTSPKALSLAPSPSSAPDPDPQAPRNRPPNPLSQSPSSTTSQSNARNG